MEIFQTITLLYWQKKGKRNEYRCLVFSCRKTKEKGVFIVICKNIQQLFENMYRKTPLIDWIYNKTQSHTDTKPGKPRKWILSCAIAYTLKHNKIQKSCVKKYYELQKTVKFTLISFRNIQNHWYISKKTYFSSFSFEIVCVHNKKFIPLHRQKEKRRFPMKLQTDSERKPLRKRFPLWRLQ